MPNFIFYDLETSGLNKNFDQIFQFAGVLTNSKLQVLDRFEVRSRRMAHIVPNPAALLVTGFRPEMIDRSEFSYYEFATAVRAKLLEWSPAIFSGYNILSFDEHFLRSLFYQNLYSPYITQTNGNSRLDILPLVRAAEFLYPDLLKLPINAKGTTSKRLEDIAPENGFSDHHAHDAMGDVMATIFIAGLIKKSAPLLWSRAELATSRAGFNALIESGKPVVVIDHNHGWPVNYPAIEVGKVDGGRNTLFFDLRFEPKLIDLNKPEVCFAGRSRPFRLCKDSEVPLTFTLDEWGRLGSTEIFDLALINRNAASFFEKIDVMDVLSTFNKTKKIFEVSEHVEAQIYDKFHAFDNEKGLIEDFHAADPSLKIILSKRFQDKRFNIFANRIVFENYREKFPRQTLVEYDERVKARMCDSGEVPWTTVPKAIAECDKLIKVREDKGPEIDKIRNYLMSLSDRGN